MVSQRTMRRSARYHIWLGWLIGAPLLFWTATGLLMVARPIDEVRGDHLRLQVEPTPIALQALASEALTGAVETRTVMQGGRAVTLARFADDSIQRFDAVSGTVLPTLTERDARTLVAARVAGGDQIVTILPFDAASVPLDFRRPLPVWQVRLSDGTHVYVGQQSGEIEAVRTRFWRAFDLAWGLHIMDIRDRENTHHPFLIAFALLSLVSVILGIVLLFRKRKAAVRR